MVESMQASTWGAARGEWEPGARSLLRGPDVILATDLDGTFLAGEARDRDALYGRVESLRERVLLIYATGRDVPHVMRLCRQGLPRPDFLIADMGTTVVRGDGAPVEMVQRWIDRRWGESAHERIHALLDEADGLQPISAHHQRRLSYHIDPARFDDRVIEQVERAGYDCYLQSTCFLDVMPRGVTKGSTLNRLLDVFGYDPQTVLVAGDTLNDWSLFAQGFNGVVVANADPRLLDQTRELNYVWHSHLHGAGAVLTALDAQLAALA